VLQESLLEMVIWDADSWKTTPIIRKAQSMLEANFDLACAVWQDVSVSKEEVTSKLNQCINEIDLIYERMLKICQFHNMKTPLSTMGIKNPLSNACNPNVSLPDMSVPPPTPSNVNVPNIPVSPLNNMRNNANENWNERVHQTPNAHTQANSVAWDRSAPYTWRNNTEHRRFDDSGYKISQTIKNWPNKFDGVRGNVNQHITLWLERTTDEITPEIVLANVEFLLEGQALQWHRTFGRRINNWYEYGRAMHNYFTSGRSESELEADFHDSRHNQQRNETFRNYVTRIQNLANKLSTHMTQERMFERVKRGLSSEYFSCKLSAKDMTELMAKCSEYEEMTKSKQHTEAAHDPFAWLKKNMSNNFPQRQNYTQNEAQAWRAPFPRSDNRQNAKPWQKPETTTTASNADKPWQRPYTRAQHTEKPWHKNRSEEEKKQTTATTSKTINGMETDENIPELSRGTQRALTDEDCEYVRLRAMELQHMANSMDFDDEQYLQFRQISVCENCHIKGHTIDLCEAIMAGIWYEHCKICKLPNVTEETCHSCTKN
jgi:hypothetical protein